MARSIILLISLIWSFSTPTRASEITIIQIPSNSSIVIDQIAAPVTNNTMNVGQVPPDYRLPSSLVTGTNNQTSLDCGTQAGCRNNLIWETVIGNLNTVRTHMNGINNQSEVHIAGNGNMVTGVTDTNNSMRNVNILGDNNQVHSTMQGAMSGMGHMFTSNIYGHNNSVTSVQSGSHATRVTVNINGSSNSVNLRTGR